MSKYYRANVCDIINKPLSERLLSLYQGEGNFRGAGIFFRSQIPCINFFQALA